MIDDFLNEGRGAFVLPILAAVAFVYFVRRYHERQPDIGHCRVCDYNLTGNVSGRCPECGTPVGEAGHGAEPGALFRRLLAEVIMAVFAVLSFYAACDSYVRILNGSRPTSHHGLYLPASACAFFLFGLIVILRKERGALPWDGISFPCLVLGLFLALSCVFLGELSR